MSSLFTTDIVNSATPLETQLAGVHPRLYGTEAKINELKAKVEREPWAGFLRRVEVVAKAAMARPLPTSGGGDDLRGVGSGLSHLVVAYRLTGNEVYFNAICRHLEAMTDFDDWTHSLMYGHWSHGVSLAYDWLYHELDPALRTRAAGALEVHTNHVYGRWCGFLDAYPTGYAWNHMGVVHAGIMSAGCALWGEVEGAGRWLRFGLEKLRLMMGALGSDGASAEGLAYGQYHNDFLFRSLTFAHDLLGEDFIHDTPFLRNYPQFMLHSMLPRSVWSPDSTFLNLGDGTGHHWYGPDTHLRFAGRHFHDGNAQWLAHELDKAAVGADSGCFLNLFWHDETVAPVAPDNLSTQHHCEDKDIVMMRSGWGAEGSVAALKCGPNSGHHSKRYRHNIGGGHMHPDAGQFVLHAHGDWLVIDEGYAVKQTSYQNVVLVNGIGQTGEGGDWFEDLEMRQGKPEGRIALVQHGETFDVIVADAAAAYKPEARLVRYLRHLLYIRPDVWVLVDELEAEADSIFEQRFHTPMPVEYQGNHTYSLEMTRGAMTVQSLAAFVRSGAVAKDSIEGIGANHPSRDIDLLTIANAEVQKKAVFVTVIEARPAARPSTLAAQLAEADGALQLSISREGTTVTVGLRTGQSAECSIFDFE